MLTSIRIFLKVVDAGSFSKAAAVLNLAPSSVARSIDTLEKDLNTTLFERSTRFLRLTDKGNIFFHGATKLINDADHLRAVLSDECTEPEGVLRISTFESFGRLHVCPIITDFLEQYPKVNVELELENKIVDLISENIDIAIRVGVPTDSQLKARTLLSNHTVLCAAPRYLSKHGIPTTPDDLHSHNCLILNQGRQRTYWHFKKNRQNKKIQIHGNLKSKGGTPLLQACIQGAGIVQLSNWMVADYVKKGELAVCLEDWEPSLNENTSGSVYALYKQTHYPNPLIRLFIDYIIEKTQNKALQRTNN